MEGGTKAEGGRWASSVNGKRLRLQQRGVSRVLVAGIRGPRIGKVAGNDPCHGQR